MKTSAGLLMYKFENDILKIFLCHPGGPFFLKKDITYWDLPKGEVNNTDGTDLIDTAIREFKEETGLNNINILKNNLISLGSVIQKNNKIVYIWGFEGNTPKNYILKSNLFELEWPPKSGNIQKFPEMDKGEFFTIDEAIIKIREQQLPFVSRLKDYLKK